MSEKCCSPCSTTRVCLDGYKYVQKQLMSEPKRAIIACEGACIKGEVARVTANILSYQLNREDTVRICLGDAATGNSGMIDLVKRAPEVIAIEGCPLSCGITMLKSRLNDIEATVIDVSRLYSFDRDEHFEIFDLPRETIDEYARKVAKQISVDLFTKKKEV